MKLRMFTHSLLFTIVLIATYIFGVQVHAARLYVEVPSGLVYDCPFDVRIMLDTQEQEVMGASLNFDLASGLDLLGLSFGETFKMSYPIQKADNNVKAYAFKFPGVISGIYDFATLRLSQRNLGSGLSKLNFIFEGTGDTTDFMDVYYFGGADILTQIDNKDFSFTPGPCAYALPTLTGDMMSSTFDPKAHMSAIQDMIDQFKTTGQNPFVSRILAYRYLVVECLALLLLILFLLMRFRRKHNESVA